METNTDLQARAALRWSKTFTLDVEQYQHPVKEVKGKPKVEKLPAKAHPGEHLMHNYNL